MVADPSSRPAGEGMPFERAQDALIAARRHLSAAETVADYADISTKAIDILAGLLGAETEGPLGDLGTYPAGILPNAFCFDHYAHTRLDLFPPRGPLTGEPPPAGALTFAPALDWAQAALPQQHGKVLADLAGPVVAVITGPGARTIQIGPPGDPVGPDNLRRGRIPALGDPAGDPGRGGRRDVRRLRATRHRASSASSDAQRQPQPGSTPEVGGLPANGTIGRWGSGAQASRARPGAEAGLDASGVPGLLRSAGLDDLPVPLGEPLRREPSAILSVVGKLRLVTFTFHEKG